MLIPENAPVRKGPSSLYRYWSARFVGGKHALQRDMPVVYTELYSLGPTVIL